MERLACAVPEKDRKLPIHYCYDEGSGCIMTKGIDTVFWSKTQRNKQINNSSNTKVGIDDTQRAIVFIYYDIVESEITNQ